VTRGGVDVVFLGDEGDSVVFVVVIVVRVVIVVGDSELGDDGDGDGDGDDVGGDVSAPWRMKLDVCLTSSCSGRRVSSTDDRRLDSCGSGDSPGLG